MVWSAITAVYGYCVNITDILQKNKADVHDDDFISSTLDIKQSYIPENNLYVTS